MKLNNLPLAHQIETPKVLKKAISANRALANLNGVARIIPNSAILINSLVLQEAKDSSAIENIITTHDELYRANLDIESVTNEAKEVQNYKEALLRGFALVKDTKLLLKKHIVEIQAVLEQNDAGVRKQAGTNLKNSLTGEVIYTPPQDYETIQELLTNLENYINEPNDIDPLVNMAIIHHQFESIHPFYDGNGRTGRIINILYLILKDLLDIPVLYLSRYIITHKADYYRLLSDVSFNDGLNEWILFMLRGVEEIARETIQTIKSIETLMNETKNIIIEQKPKIYSKDLLEALFYHPYTKKAFIVEHLKISRPTVTNYLNELENIGILSSKKIGKEIFYIHTKLFDLFKDM